MVDWEVQIKLEHLSDDTLQRWEGIDQMLRPLDTLSGERRVDGSRCAARETIFLPETLVRIAECVCGTMRETVLAS